jgi:hypothetical protein
MANIFECCSLGKRGQFFCDSHGRALLFRGINCSGMSKLPAKEERTGDRLCTSFTGRPFAVSDARQHFERLVTWGFSLIRLVVTWEAVQPNDHSSFDEEYLEYLREIASIARDCGLLVLLDLHQDCWSRHSGGSGAPLWTFHVSGLYPPHFAETGAAVLSGYDSNGKSEITELLWSTNYTKFACCTMFTLFWAGEVFAPGLLYQGQNVGVFLRQKYMLSIQELCRRLRGLIVGVDLMNEPYASCSLWCAAKPLIHLQTSRVHRDGKSACVGLQRKFAPRFHALSSAVHDDSRWLLRQSSHLLQNMDLRERLSVVAALFCPNCTSQRRSSHRQFQDGARVD